jgi:transcription elongation GreA/GreB family factor
MTSKTTAIYHIVSNEESSFIEGKISISSPLGMVLKDKKVGDIVKLKRQNGDILFEILEISY